MKTNLIIAQPFGTYQFTQSIVAPQEKKFGCSFQKVSKGINVYE